jgi:hypothetical protein
MVVVVLLTLSACHGSPHSTASPSTDSVESSTTTSPAPSTTTTLPPAPTSTTSTTASTETALATGLRCRSSKLTVVLPGGSGAAGTVYFNIVFRNDSGSSCEMTGYPGVSFLDASGVQIGVPAQRIGATYAQVSLAPHMNAYAALAVPNPDVRGCPTATAHFVRVFPPNETRPLLIKVDESNASGTTDGIRVCAQQVPPGAVSPVVARPKF